jgi:hypothetical protein
MARRAAAVLDRRLLVAAALLAAAWVAWSLLAPELDAGSDLATVVVAAVVAVPLLAGAIVAALPVAEARPRWTIGAGLVALAVAIVCIVADWPVPASLAKAVAGAALGLVLGRLLEEPWHAALIAVLVAIVDMYSVFAGPTKEIVEHRPGVLDTVGIAFAAPGYQQAAVIGTTDFVFLGLLGGAALRYDLRPRLTLPLLALSFSVTMLLTYWLDRDLPALPLLSAAFLLPNLDRVLPRRG